MADDDPVKGDRAPFWPLLALIPALGALIVAVWEFDRARIYVQDDPCITSWDVPWAGQFAALSTIGIVAGMVSLLLAYSFRGTNTRAVAIVSLIIGIAIWFLALMIHSGPYGWHCWRA